MARPRRTPRTPFGRWLDGWLDEHPEKTLEALGVDIARAVGREKPLTDGAISQWLSGATRRIDLENLRGLSIVTGEPLENLEILVYGGATRAAATPSISLPQADLEAMLQRAAETGARMVIEEMRREDRAG